MPATTIAHPFGNSFRALFRQLYAATVQNGIFLWLFLLLVTLTIPLLARGRRGWRTFHRFALPLVAGYALIAWAGILLFGLLSPESKIS